MTNIRILRENSGVAKRRLRKYSVEGRYQKMVESEPDKTNFNRPPYYMTTKKKSQYKKLETESDG